MIYNFNTFIFLYLCLSQLLAVFCFPLWFMMAMTSMMAFDSGVSILPVLFVALLWSIPLIQILFSWFAWRSYKAQRPWKAALLTTPVLLLSEVVLYMTGHL